MVARNDTEGQKAYKAAWYVANRARLGKTEKKPAMTQEEYRAHRRAIWQASRDAISERRRAAYAADPNKTAKASARYLRDMALRPGLVRARGAKNTAVRRLQRPDADQTEAQREHKRAISRERWRMNPALRAALESCRRARKLNATPRWLTKEHHALMRGYYELAAEIGYHVDHIIPLKGKQICGLHVPWNLQVITPSENLAKGNRLRGLTRPLPRA